MGSLTERVAGAFDALNAKIKQLTIEADEDAAEIAALRAAVVEEQRLCGFKEEVITNLRAQLAERDRQLEAEDLRGKLAEAQDALAQAKEHIHMAMHPELGWVWEEPEIVRLCAQLAERDRQLDAAREDEDILLRQVEDALPDGALLDKVRARLVDLTAPAAERKGD